MVVGCCGAICTFFPCLVAHYEDCIWYSRPAANQISCTPPFNVLTPLAKVKPSNPNDNKNSVARQDILERGALQIPRVHVSSCSSEYQRVFQCDLVNSGNGRLHLCSCTTLLSVAMIEVRCLEEQPQLPLHGKCLFIQAGTRE